MTSKRNLLTKKLALALVLVFLFIGSIFFGIHTSKVHADSGFIEFSIFQSVPTRLMDIHGLLLKMERPLHIVSTIQLFILEKLSALALGEIVKIPIQINTTVVHG